MSDLEYNDPSWPHLDLIYDILWRLINTPEFSNNELNTKIEANVLDKGIEGDESSDSDDDASPAENNAKQNDNKKPSVNQVLDIDSSDSDSEPEDDAIKQNKNNAKIVTNNNDKNGSSSSSEFEDVIKQNKNDNKKVEKNINVNMDKKENGWNNNNNNNNKHKVIRTGSGGRFQIVKVKSDWGKKKVSR